MSDLDMMRDLQIVLDHAVLCGHERAELERSVEKGGMTEYKYQCMLKNHIVVINHHRGKSQPSRLHFA
jgi:hypothetical protein